MNNSLLYGLALLLVIMAPFLGLLAAAVGTWHAVSAGSMLYMPLGLAIVLAAIALFQSHKKGDLVLLALLIAGVASWFMANARTRAGALEWVSAVADETALLIGLLVLAVMTLGLIYTFRLIASRGAARFRLTPPTYP